MGENKIAEWIWDNKRDVGIFLGAVWGLLSGGVWVYKKTNPFIKSIKTASKAIDEIPEISKKIDSIVDKQNANIELNSDPMFENDANGNCVRANDALCTLFGCKKKELMYGDGWTDYVIFKPGEDEHFKERINSGANEIGGSYIIKNGNLQAQYIALVIRDKENKVTGIIGKVYLI